MKQVFSPATTWEQFVSLSRLRTSIVLHEIPFWALVGLMAVFAINNGYFAGRVAGLDVWPVTYLMVQAVEGGATLFFYIVAALYAAELIWRERDVHFEGIHDSLPMGEGIDWLSKLVAIAVVEFMLLTVTILCGVAMQTLAGYYHYELLQYFKEMYIVVFPQVLTLRCSPFHSNHGQQQVPRSRHRDRRSSCSCPFWPLAVGKTRCTCTAPRRPTPIAT